MSKLSQHLKATGEKQHEFAERVGVTQATISKLSSGKVHPSPLTAAKIQAATYGAVPWHAWPEFAIMKPGALESLSAQDAE